MTDQEYRLKFVAALKGELNLSCHVDNSEIRCFADPKVEIYYQGWKRGFIMGSAK